MRHSSGRGNNFGYHMMVVYILTQTTNDCWANERKIKAAWIGYYQLFPDIIGYLRYSVLNS